MKKTFKFAAVICAFASLVACNKYAEYNVVPFVSLDKSSIKVDESENGTTITLPVHVYNAGATTVSYDIVEGTAKSGVDYTASGSGVLTFSEGTDTQDIQITVTGQPGKYTGDLKFKVELKSATDGVTLGTIKTCTFTIVDKDFRGDWNWLAGKWKGTDYDWPGTGAPQADEYEVIIEKVSETECKITNLWAGGETIKATVDFDNNLLSIPAWQLIYTDPVDGPCVMAWGNGTSSLSQTKPILCSLSGDGIAIGGPDLGCCYYVYITTGEYAGYGYGMTVSKLTK